ncbi:MAG: erg24, C-14 sterol reductase [Cirrosporium novae-zelandiae]|nr:MAG: erg24, C-14 sterol reductase [Cirrosporium novae-zelandiae]
MSKAARPQVHYEFLGPPGAFLISFGLPILCYVFAFACNDISGCPAPSLLHPSTLTLQKLKQETGWPENGLLGLGSLKTTGWVLAYYFLSLVLQAVLPGHEVEGVELRSGGRLKYKFNAFNSAAVILVLAASGTVYQGTPFPLWTYIWDHYTEILTANILISFFLATFVYVRSFSVRMPNKSNRELAAGGVTGSLIYDWFIGRELNPRVTLPLFGTIDIKSFMELRPGLLGWVILDLTFVVHQYSTHGYISDSILLVTAFQSWYVLDALWMEPAILTTMDIVTDGFGLMLAFGDVVWVPFIYSLQARYLSMFPVHLGATGISIVLGVQALGYYIFRSANNEKNRFRTDPSDPKIRHLKYMQTKAGSKLLVSGWWGTARHINYLGDWIMAWSYSLPTSIAGYRVLKDTGVVTQEDMRGWGMLVTYFYVVYFGTLLVHREQRDEEKCAKKYGSDWEEYKRRVRWRVLPGVY